MIDRTRPAGSGPSSTRARGGGSVPGRSPEAPKVEEASHGSRFGFFEELVRDGVVVVLSREARRILAALDPFARLYPEAPLGPLDGILTANRRYR
jgi:hypothetical protein